MRKILVKLLTNKKIGNQVIELGKFLLPPHDRQVLHWKQIKADKTLRLDYNLNKDSIVFDMGGYEGQWTSDIFSKYCCRVYVFEPVELFASNIKKRFILNKKISVYQYGLASENTNINLYLDDDATNSTIKRGIVTKAKLANFKEFIDKNQIKKIDLMKINTEGGEYDLLEYIIDIDWLKNITNLQVQFHEFVPNAEKRMLNIQNHLKKTHHLTYQYRFLWENWSKFRNN